MRQGIGVCAFVLAAGLFLDGDLEAGSLEPPGPPAPTMKTLDEVESRIPISSLPFTIDQAGSYYLTRNLTAVSGQPGINITSSFVTLDLNGFSLIGAGAGLLHGINSSVAGTEHLVIRNGVIRNWGGLGISAPTTADVHAEDLRVDNNLGGGLLIGARSIVRGVTSTGNSGTGIQTGASSTITGCTAGSNTVGIAPGSYSTVSSSTAAGNSVDGFNLNAGSSATDCTAQGNAQGFFLSSQGSRVLHSMARLNTTGIFGGDGVSVEECIVDGNAEDGIRVGNRGLVRGNYARGNLNEGIQATGAGNRIEDNEVTQNGTGIRVDGVNNLVVKNSGYLNAAEFAIVGGNKAGVISADPTTANPWANFDL